MQMPVQIRLVRPDDEKQLCEIIEEAWNYQRYSKKKARCKCNCKTYFFGICNGAVVYACSSAGRENHGIADGA